MAVENNQQNEPEEIITVDDIYEGNADDLNRKIEKIYQERLGKALDNYRKEHPEPPVPPKATEDILKEFECFASDDEDVKEAAQAMLERELSRLPADAEAGKIREACDKVARRVAKLAAEKDGDKGGGEAGPYGKGPVQTGGGGAAGAHINDKPPETIDEAYELSARIADSWGKK